MGDQHPYLKFESYASIVAVDPTATTYKLDCIEAGETPNFDRRPGCDGMRSVTMTVGPSVAKFTAILSQSISGEGTDYGIVDQ